MMQTRCPACQTLYRIDEDVLQRAGGQARCFRCDNVFDAYSNRLDDQAEPDDSLPTLDMDTDATIDSDLDPDDTGVLADPGEPMTRPFADDEADTRPPIAFDAEPQTEPSPDGAHPLDGADIDASGRHAPDLHADDSRPLDSDSFQMDTLDVPSELSPDLLRDDPAPPVSAAAIEPPSHLPGIALAALLIVLVLGQLAWFNRDQVIATPQGRALAEGICDLAGCSLPPRRAPSRYTVMHRDIGAAPDSPGVLVMDLRFRNDADFAQPLPDIQLSLYDSEEKLLARRRLHAHEYLFPAPPETARVAPGEQVAVTLKLQDPGRHTTGFKLEFL